MAKHVFRPTEVVNLTRKVSIEPPITAAEEELAEEIPEYTGPTAEDLRLEAEAAALAADIRNPVADDSVPPYLECADVFEGGTEPIDRLVAP